ncbi:DUF6931 family protein [Moellerella wisconsensis]|uniref:DUF6931 family protein n=1 Tax=Moellerella wisconsensis TaxID=158849 RepID=UPI000640D195|nr:hypothetical protein [Moellerella wisconsensis]KLN95827.1 hypothetical protein VK86_13260 [Moellerella wisconsensis]
MELIKIPYKQVNDILIKFAPDKELLVIAKEYAAPLAFINQLNTLARHTDLVLFLAHALPVRESVWWACCCSQLIHSWQDNEHKALQAAQMWVRYGDEKCRQLAGNAVTSSGLDTGAGWVAQAAFWSGGSMLDNTQPAVAPPQFLYAQAVAGAINLMVALSDNEQESSLYLPVIEIALDIAKGGNGTAAIDQGRV